MKFFLKRWGGTKPPDEIQLDMAVRETINYNGHDNPGELESMQERIEQQTKMLGKLIGHLIDNETLNGNQVAELIDHYRITVRP